MKKNKISDRYKDKNPFFYGLLMAMPIFVGYMALGIPFGVLAAKANIPVWIVACMSFFIFAGSAQFVALQLITAQAGLWTIMGATFFLNLRHLLMAISLGSALPKIRVPFLSYLAQSITDESYGVNIIKTQQDKHLHPMSMFGTNIMAHASWICATILGAWLGNIIPIKEDYLSGALPLMFVVLLGLQLTKKIYYIIALVSVLLTMGLIQILSGSAVFLLTALIVPTVATLYKMKRGAL